MADGAPEGLIEGVFEGDMDTLGRWEGAVDGSSLGTLDGEVEGF